MARQHFADVEAAMAALPVPVEHRAQVRAVIADVPQLEVWIPAGESYVAVADASGPVSAYINRTFVDVRTGVDAHDRTWLSGAAGPSARSPRGAQRSHRPEALCGCCSTVLPVTGRCGYCR